VVIEQFKKELDIIRATPPLTLHETLDSLDSLEKVYGQLAGSFSSNEDQHSILFSWVEKLVSRSAMQRSTCSVLRHGSYLNQIPRS